MSAMVTWSRAGRRLMLGLALLPVLAFAAAPGEGALAEAGEAAERFATLRTLQVAVAGELRLARAYGGASLDAPANVKSASKTLIAALIGVAIERGVLEGTDQRVARLLRDALPADPDPRLREITVGHLLSMQAGLERTSGGNYGAWVASDNWVRAALAMPFDDEPGGRMLYSTGNSHLLSAILTRETGRPTDALANDWLAPAGIRVTSWLRDPQGIPLGGNQVAMRPAALLALGELYRRGGRTEDGTRLLSERWVRESWTARARSRFTGDGYGYGWFVRDFGGYRGYYGWGYGGQMLYVVPDLELTVAITSGTDRPSGRTGYREALHGFLAEHIIPAVAADTRPGDGDGGERQARGASPPRADARAVAR